MLLHLAASAVAVVIGAHLVRAIYRLVHWSIFSPFRYMPGPPNPSWIYGNFGNISFAKTQAWQERYGPTYRFHGLMSATQLYTIDTVALHHIVNKSDIYQKSPMIRFTLRSMLGEGLLVAEDDEHTKLRKVMSPAFGPSQIRGLTQLFVDKSLELSKVWGNETPDDSGWARIDVLAGLRAMTLDVIGLAGFNYQFHALDAEKPPTALDDAFQRVFHQGNQGSSSALLRARFPFLRPFIPAPKGLAGARRTMDRIGIQLLDEARVEIASGEKETGRKDILSLLVQSNTSANIPESHRLSDEAVVAQLPTFFVAGHETTSTATTWALYALALNPEAQTKLRAELQAIGTDSPSLDTLNALPYLDKVVREVMRVHAPVVFTSRIAMRDDVIPLETPYTDTRGVQQESIVVAKGQMIHIPVRAVNRDPRIWGPDSAEFKPDRWDTVPDAANAIPGVWSHLFSFLGGPHNCIGWRFSLAEMKALMYTLIRTFEFEMAVPAEAIDQTTTAVQRPLVVSEREKGPQLPMRVRRVQS
ncbi:cytochrome P450 [Mycena polygramma]|nr:cytochrome P450 [Mycena polygramma]